MSKSECDRVVVKSTTVAPSTSSKTCRMFSSDSNLVRMLVRSTASQLKRTDTDPKLKNESKSDILQPSLSSSSSSSTSSKRSSEIAKKKSKKNVSIKSTHPTHKRSWLSHPLSLMHCCLTSTDSLSEIGDDDLPNGGIIELPIVSENLIKEQEPVLIEESISSVDDDVDNDDDDGGDGEVEVAQELNTTPATQLNVPQFNSNMLMPIIDFISSTAAATVSSSLSASSTDSSSANSNSLQISSTMSSSSDSAQNAFERETLSESEHNIDSGNLDLLFRFFRQSRHISYLSTFPSGSNNVSGTQTVDNQENKLPLSRYPLQCDDNNEADRLRSLQEAKLQNFIHTQIDYVNYLVPDQLAITNCSFYWGKIDRYEAEHLLEGKPEGTFLLRDSAQEDHLFSVSFRRFKRSLHARIEQWRHHFSFDSHDPGVFFASSVIDLIEHYKDPSHCMFFEPMLTKPLNRNFVFSLQHLARVNICDRVTYETINTLPIPNVLKSYLKEYHYRTKVRTTHFDDTYRYIDNYCTHCQR